MSKRHKTKSAPTNTVTPGTIHSIPLISVPLDEFKAVHARISTLDEGEATRIAREFRTSQPDLYKCVPYTDSTPREEAHENSSICAWARRVCAIIEARHGMVPILAEAQILKSEVLAKKMLAEPETFKRIRNMDLIRAAEIGILERTDSDPNRFAPVFAPLRCAPPVGRCGSMAPGNCWRPPGGAGRLAR